MKKRAFMLVGILLISIVMSACSSNSKSTTNENETTIIQAEYPVYDTAEEIVDASDLVFSGTVTEINYESLNVKSETGADSETGLVEATEIPYTIFDISIEKVYKGNVESSSISIKRPGGKIDGQFFVVEGTSTIEVGETYLFIILIIKVCCIRTYGSSINLYCKFCCIFTFIFRILCVPTTEV